MLGCSDSPWRPATPLEHLAIQGFDVYSSKPMPLVKAVKKLLESEELTSNQVKQMAGNSMHFAAIGSVIAFVLMTCSVRTGAEAGQQGAA